MNNEVMVNSIRDICKKNDISPTKLEEELGFSQGLISRWKDKTPSIDKIVDIADYFNVTLDELVGRTLKSNKITSEQFSETLYEMTTNKTLVWEDFTNQISKLENDKRFLLEDEGFSVRELFVSNYNKGYFILYCQYDEERGNISDIDVQIFIRPDNNSKAVLQNIDNNIAIQLWLYIHTVFYGTLDETKAEDLKSSFVMNEQDPIKKYKDNPEELKKIYKELLNRNPEFLEVFEKLNTPEIQYLQKRLSNPDFVKALESTSHLAIIYKELFK